MSAILEKLGHNPVKQTENDAWYLSPFRNEKTASFHVITKTNRWHDFGDAVGGDSLDFVRAHMKASGVFHDTSDALRWMDNMMGNNNLPTFIPSVAHKAEKALTVRTIKPITQIGLIYYLEQRGIDVVLAKKHLKQVEVINKTTGKRFYALGLKNEENGYELRNKYFKGCVRKKHITFIRGTVPKPDGIHVFEGMFDYLTFLTLKKKHQNDVIILNSLSCLNKGMAYIKGYNYKYAYTWLDNDNQGDKATELFAAFCKTENDLTHKPASAKYVPYKDLNAWHMDNLNLTL